MFIPIDFDRYVSCQEEPGFASPSNGWDAKPGFVDTIFFLGRTDYLKRLYRAISKNNAIAFSCRIVNA
jgi:hypothetical protein